jgi:peptidoglycan/LPS O-acetylase OafA/YrhL
MVVVFHSYGAAYGFQLSTLTGAPFDLIDHLAGGVYLFFALSGYLISRPFVAALARGEDLPALGRYARKRVLRIYPVYLLAFAVQLTVSKQWHTPPALLVVHALLFHNLVRGQSNAIYVVSWTLSLEVLFYLFVPLVALLVRRLRPGPIPARRLALAVGAMWASSFVWALVVGSQNVTTTTTWLGYLFPGMLGMFCPGILAAVAEHRVRQPGGVGDRIEGMLRDPALVVATVVALYLVGSALAAGGPTSSQLGVLVSHHTDALAYGLLLAMVLRVDLPERWWWRALAWLGVISYGIYLWQGVLGDLWVHHEWLFPLKHGLGVATIPAIAVIILVPTVLVSWATWTWLESPFLRLAHRSRRPGAVVAAATG